MKSSPTKGKSKTALQIKREMKRQIKEECDKTFADHIAKKLSLHVIHEFKFHDKRKWRIDHAIPTHKIAIEVEGGVWTKGRHVNPSGFISDMDKYNALSCAGWMLLRVQPKDLYSEKLLDNIRECCTNKEDHQKG